MKTYTLQELADIDIDLWVEAMSNLAEKHGSEIDGFKDNMDECPAEYEFEFSKFAEDRGIRFTLSAKIAENLSPRRRSAAVASSQGGGEGPTTDTEGW